MDKRLVRGVNKGRGGGREGWREVEKDREG